MKCLKSWKYGTKCIHGRVSAGRWTYALNVGWLHNTYNTGRLVTLLKSLSDDNNYNNQSGILYMHDLQQSHDPQPVICTLCFTYTLSYLQSELVGQIALNEVLIILWLDNCLFRVSPPHATGSLVALPNSARLHTGTLLRGPLLRLPLCPDLLAVKRSGLHSATTWGRTLEGMKLHLNLHLISFLSPESTARNSLLGHTEKREE